MATRSWRRSGRWRGNIKTHCSPVSVRSSATPLQLCCSRLPISRVLFGGCIRDINNWEVPSSSMAFPRGTREGAEVHQAERDFCVCCVAVASCGLIHNTTRRRSNRRGWRAVTMKRSFCCIEHGEKDIARTARKIVIRITYEYFESTGCSSALTGLIGGE